MRAAMAGVVLMLVGFSTSAGAQVPTARPGSPGWVRADPACFIWSNDPQPGETAHWTGRCVNARGVGTGKLTWYIDGEVNLVYTGPLRDGRAEGRGTYDWPDRRRYVGDFRGGRMEGQGVYTWPNGDRYFGAFHDDERDGHGVFQWDNGDRYEGEIRRGAMSGRGMISIAGGRYTGELIDAIPDGFGIFISPAGNFGGHWRHGCFNDGTRRLAVGVVPTVCE